MNGKTEWDEELDARGHLCPIPVLKARKKLKSMRRGAVLRLLADDPAAVIDVPHFCAEAGHDLIGSHQIGEGESPRIYLIRKG